jgi:hypothetical protein
MTGTIGLMICRLSQNLSLLAVFPCGRQLVGVSEGADVFNKMEVKLRQKGLFGVVDPPVVQFCQCNRTVTIAALSPGRGSETAEVSGVVITGERLW